MALYRNQRGDYVQAGETSPGPDWYQTTAPLPQRGDGGNSLLSNYTKLADQVRAANLKREQEIRGLYGGIIGQNTKDSLFYKAGMQDIETESQRLVGQETQGLISSGLYGTTTAASVPTKVATQFTQPSRMKLEDILQQRKSEAQLGLAGFVERINEPYPDYSALMQAYTAMGSR